MTAKRIPKNRTILHRLDGQWDKTDARRLAGFLDAPVRGYSKYPEFLVLEGNFAAGQISSSGLGSKFTIVRIMGSDDKKFLFPVFENLKSPQG